MSLDSFIARWSASGDAERANKDSFLGELCDVLGVERPHPKTGDPARDLYVFEKDVTRTRAGGTSIGRVDLYKHGSFLLAEKLLESLAAVGVAIETTAGGGGQRTWRLVR